MNATKNTNDTTDVVLKLPMIRSLYKKYGAEKSRMAALFGDYEEATSPRAQVFMHNKVCDVEDTLRLIEDIYKKLPDGDKVVVDLFLVFWQGEGCTEWIDTLTELNKK